MLSDLLKLGDIDLENESRKYNKHYYCGKGSNYIFGYNNLRFKVFWLRRVKLLQKIVSAGNLLDIGCAFGFFIKMLEKNYQVYGMDISEYAVEQAKKLISNPEHIKCYDMNKGIPFEEKFNLIVAFDILEHLKDPLMVFNIISKSLAKEGSVYLELPLSKTLIDRDQGHNYRPLEDWLGLLSLAGFKVWFIKTYYTIGFRNIMIPSRQFGNYCSIIAKQFVLPPTKS